MTMSIDEYRLAVIRHLKSGKASARVWREVAEHLSAESEMAPLLLDVELSLAVECRCGFVRWNGDECEHCVSKHEVA